MLRAMFRRLFGPRPQHNPAGAWVAEVWLEHEICTGSTMYRERFDDRDAAAREAKRAAVFLDWFVVPSRGDIGIHWGVRPAAPNERPDAIWSPAMPGRPGYAGEHWQSHPLNPSNRGR